MNQYWVINEMHGTPSPKKAGDMGIDGYNIEGTPIQVKQSERVGRNVVDNFETAIRRKSKKKGIIIAFSFVKSVYEEIARAEQEGGLKIKAITVEELLKKNNKK